uniref:Uncharacterized protein n=1 Tax=Talaromyces marneffei PM1 TaxID=1077442 RepID=A0A093UR65_TALMA
MSQVDTMVQSYQLKTAYFPFVSIPENITAETLCQKWPFLLLSILVISSADEPILQKALDERFRKVLATRVVMQGEKSLDYLHGLLVYLSCIAMGFRRSNNFTFIPSNELLDSMLLLNDGPLEPIIASIVKLCKFIEKVHGINLQTEMAKLSSWTLECPLQKLTQMLIGELTQLERELPAHIYTKKSPSQNTIHAKIRQNKDLRSSTGARETSIPEPDQSAHFPGSIPGVRFRDNQPVTTEQKLPDLFYLFYTVLRLFKANLMRELEQLSSGQIPPNNANQSNKPPSSRCPVVNGDIQSTDYWTMWMNSNNLMSDVELFGVQGGEFPDFDINDPAVFDWVLGLISLFDSLLILI